MAVVQVSTAPNRELYDKVSSILGDEASKGLIAHAAVELPSGEVQITDIYESEADLKAFAEQRLFPAFEKAGVLDMVAANEPPTPHEAFHVVTPR